jgi:hypothetical protein
VILAPPPLWMPPRRRLVCPPRPRFDTLNMAAPGKVQRNTSGKLNTRSGKVVRNADAASVCCCEEGPPDDGHCFYYARRCKDNVKTGYSFPCPLSAIYYRKNSNGVCYYFPDPPLDFPGVDLGATTTITNCSDASCSDVTPTDDPLPPDDHVATFCCPTASFPGFGVCNYPTVTLSAGGNFDCPDLYDPSDLDPVPGPWDGKMDCDPGSCGWGAGPAAADPTAVVFGAKLIFDCGVQCQPAGAFGFEAAGGWLLNIGMQGRAAIWSYNYRKIGGSTPSGGYTYWDNGSATCEAYSLGAYGTSGTAPGNMSIG